MGNIFKTLGLVSDDGDEKSQSSETKVASPAPIPTPTTPIIPVTSSFNTDVFASAATPATESPDPKKDAAVKELFQKILTDNNIAGMDYYEFRAALKALDDMGESGMSEVQKYRSVFASFVAQGCDKDRLIATANQYLTILKSKKEEIQKAIEVKRTSDVDALHNQVSDIEKMNVGIETQIESLRKTISDNQEKIFKLNSQIETNTRTLREREELINSEYIRVTGDIQTDISRINEYLTTTKA